MSNDPIKEYAKSLKALYPGQVKLDEPLSRHTTYQVGGPAAALCDPASIEILKDIILRCRKDNIPFYILGSGSNVLVHDRGINMIIIRLLECASDIYMKGNELYAGAGGTVESLVEYCETHDLGGVDFMSGIPGTVGGALRMNAGAFSGEIGDRVTSIEVFTNDGSIISIPGSEAGFGYRRANELQNKIILGCHLKVEKGSRSDLKKAREEYLKRRADKQPQEYGSCGSVFKRPPGNYAGVLIEQTGCKGLQVGGAMVSEKHANFIVNYDNAAARDIYQLIRKVQKRVYNKFDVWLELEVKLIGFSHEEKEEAKK